MKTYKILPFVALGIFIIGILSVGFVQSYTEGLDEGMLYNYECYADSDCEFGIKCIDGQCLYRDEGMLDDPNEVEEVEEQQYNPNDPNRAGSCDQYWECSNWKINGSFQVRECEWSCGLPKKDKPIEYNYLGDIMHFYNEKMINFTEGEVLENQKFY